MRRLPFITSPTLFLVTALMLFSNACTLQAATSARDRPQNAIPDSICEPTGSALVDTGIYLAPEGCSQITLQPLDENSAANDAWIMEVSWPMYGEHHVLEVTNLETGDSEKELFYKGDPNFVLYTGNYSLGGLQMVTGANRIQFNEHNFEDDENGQAQQIIIRQGTFVVTINTM